MLLLLLIIILSCVLISYNYYHHHLWRSRRPPLPPGSMGWPYVGETFRLYSNNPIEFLNLKYQRHGPIFKSRILGCPCVMVTSWEAARFVLVTRASLFKPGYPSSKQRMLGPHAIIFQQGDHHARLRRLVLRAFMPDAIRRTLPDIQDAALQALASWEARRTINTFLEMKTYAINVALLSIFGKAEVMSFSSSYLDELKHCYLELDKGYNSLPINLPGTLFYRAMKARRHLARLAANILSARRRKASAAPTDHDLDHDGDHSNDLLSDLMAMDGDHTLTDEQIADNIIGLIFAARDTTATVLTWIIKYLGENPTVLHAVTEEQEAIMKSKKVGDGEEYSLTWDDAKKMVKTCRVIQETMRVASILSFTFREAVEDVVYEGYLIPKGWKVLPVFRNIHHCPENFTNPEKFDPSRFETAPKPNTFLPFGNGSHSCPGNELARLEMLVLLHHLTTKYTWLESGSDSGIRCGPFLLPLNGLPLEFFRKMPPPSQD